MAKKKPKIEVKPRRETCDFCNRKREKKFFNTSSLLTKTVTYCAKAINGWNVYEDYVDEAGAKVRMHPCEIEFRTIKKHLDSMSGDQKDAMQKYFALN